MNNVSIFYISKILLLLFLLAAANTHAGNSKLINLIQHNDAVAVKKLLNKRFINLEKRNKQGDTALLIAARNSQWEIFDILVSYGANINVLAANDRDILNLSVRVSNLEMAIRAINAGISTQTFTPSYQGSALIFAAAEGEVGIVEALINAGAPIDRRNNLGWTALLEAIVLGNGSKPYQQIVSLLLKAGADRNITDKFGRTPLDLAKKKSYQKIAELLISCQPDQC